MKTSIFLLLLGLCTYGGEAVTHSLKYFYTASTQIPNFPEFVTVGMVDDQEIEHYDSITGRAQVKQDWLAKYIADSDPQYSERNTQIYMGSQQTYKANIEIAKGRFNQTGGVHILQVMYGCDWDDETKKGNGYYQFGYDGEDFIAIDSATETWTAAKQQAFLSKVKLDPNKALTTHLQNYFSQECPQWIEKYLSFGKSSLMRTELPSVSLLQKSSSSPISCHATGFYPDRAELVWRKDGVEFHEGVVKGEILPNNDGTFQMSVDLKLSVKPEEWERYDCVFQLSGEEDIITKLDKIKTNEENSMVIPIVVAAIVLAVIAVIAVIGLIVYKRKNKRPPSPVDNCGVHEEMMAPGATDS